jgi:hypothetical protein
MMAFAVDADHPVECAPRRAVWISPGSADERRFVDRSSGRPFIR